MFALYHTASFCRQRLLPQPLQVCDLTRFIGMFAFPLAAGRMIAEMGSAALLALVRRLLDRAGSAAGPAN